jgi:hypothetical protein
MSNNKTEADPLRSSMRSHRPTAQAAAARRNTAEDRDWSRALGMSSARLAELRQPDASGSRPRKARSRSVSRRSR